MRACLFEAEQERIGKKHGAFKYSVLPASVLHNVLTGLSKFKLGNITCTTYDQLTFLPGESRNSRSCIIVQKLGKGSIVGNICADADG